MKKLLMASVVVLLVVALMAVAGCGGDTGKAKDQMKVADDAYNKVKTQMDELQNSLTAVLGGAVSGNFSALTPDVVKKADDGIKAVVAELPAVKAEYQKITTLKGVDDYVTYANDMIKTVDLDESVLKQGQQLVEAIAPMIQAGNTAGVTQYFTANSAQISKLQDQSAAASKAYDDAQAFKADKNLGK